MSQRSRGGIKAGLVLVLGLSALGVGCGGAAEPAERPTRELKKEAFGTTFETPARWISFVQATEPTGSVVLADGRCLVTTEDGYRWIISEPAHAENPCDGRGRLSHPNSVPHGLIGVARQGSHFRFVDSKGAVYSTQSPDGPFESVTSPPAPLQVVRAGGGTIVGIGAGTTYTFDGAWKTSSVPSESFGADLTVGQDGRVLWLGVPEDLLISVNGGASFGRGAGAPPRPVGVYELVTTADGFGAHGLVGDLTWDGRGLRQEAPPASVARPPHLESVEIPDLDLVSEGQGALFGRFILQYRSEPPGLLFWALSPGEKSPEPIDLPFLAECNAVRIATNEPAIAIMCATMVEQRVLGKVFVSTDRGVNFKPLGDVYSPSYLDLSHAVSKGGTVVALGGCTEASSGINDVGHCGAITLGEGGRWAPKIPDFSEHSGNHPAISSDGRSVYFLGQTAEGAAAIYASNNGGRAFSRHLLEIPPNAWEEGDEEANGEEVSWDKWSRLTIDASGVLGLITSDCSWVLFDASGRPERLVRPPRGCASIGGFGAHALAISADNLGGIFAYESSDGGDTWQPVEPPQDWPSGVFACFEGGCVVRTSVRFGWEAEEDTSPPAEPVQELFGDLKKSEILSPIDCELGKAPWTHLSALTGESGGPNGPADTRLPSVGDMARGGTLFSLVVADPLTGAVDVISAPMEADGGPSLTRRSLLPKGPRAVVQPVGQGVVVYRPEPKNVARVAWSDEFREQIGERTITLSAPAPASPRRLSLTEEGVDLWLNYEETPLLVPRDGPPRVDVSRAHQGPPSNRVAHETTFQERGGWTILTEGLGGKIVGARTISPTKEYFSIPIFRGPEKGIGVWPNGTSGPDLRAYALFPDEGGLGPTLRLPRIDSTPIKPGCSKSERASLPRLVVHGASQSQVSPGRHPVRVVDRAAGPAAKVKGLSSTAETWHWTDGVVLFGTEKSACSGALHGAAVTEPQAVYLSGDLKQAWLVRRRTLPKETVLEARPMRCSSSPDLEIPSSVMDALDR